MTAPIPEPAHRSGCATCATSACCVRLEPELTGFDIARLARARGLAADEIARLAPGHGDLAQADGVLLDGPDRVWLLQLRPADPRAPRAERRCAFLLHLAPGVDRCGVYAHRPMLCRTFPTELTVAGVMVATPEAICPPNAWDIARTDLAGARQVHLRAAIERELHRAALARWNAAASEREAAPRDAVIAAFFAWLERVTAALEAALAPHLATPAAVEAAARDLDLPRDGDDRPADALGPSAGADAGPALVATLRAALDRFPEHRFR
ncbi:MAG: YkgJ family cysteine cluster protein [Deltaproteobacteria bacterium]|nr:YkgJ family cysteine cluster protein [Deltaproteobacteria bacterium]